MFQVPAVLAERASRELGAEGRNWIRQLPDIITAAQHRWSLGLEAVLPLGKELSVLIGVTMPGSQPAVLKASYPNARPRHEAAALARVRASWLAVDPCPLTGDAEFDVADLTADLLDDYIGQSAAPARLRTTLSVLCQAIPHLDRQRVLLWMLAKRVSLALDSIAATGNGDWDLAFARLLLAEALALAPSGPGSGPVPPETCNRLPERHAENRQRAVRFAVRT